MDMYMGLAEPERWTNRILNMRHPRVIRPDQAMNFETGTYVLVGARGQENSLSGPLHELHHSTPIQLKAMKNRVTFDPRPIYLDFR